MEAIITLRFEHFTMHVAELQRVASMPDTLHDGPINTRLVMTEEKHLVIPLVIDCYDVHLKRFKLHSNRAIPLKALGRAREFPKLVEKLAAAGWSVDLTAHGEALSDAKPGLQRLGARLKLLIAPNQIARLFKRSILEPMGAAIRWLYRERLLFALAAIGVTLTSMAAVSERKIPSTTTHVCHKTVVTRAASGFRFNARIDIVPDRDCLTKLHQLELVAREHTILAAKFESDQEILAAQKKFDQELLAKWSDHALTHGETLEKVTLLLLLAEKHPDFLPHLYVAAHTAKKMRDDGKSALEAERSEAAGARAERK